MRLHYARSGMPWFPKHSPLPKAAMIYAGFAVGGAWRNCYYPPKFIGKFHRKQSRNELLSVGRKRYSLRVKLSRATYQTQHRVTWIRRKRLLCLFCVPRVCVLTRKSRANVGWCGASTETTTRQRAFPGNAPMVARARLLSRVDARLRFAKISQDASLPQKSAG